MSTTLVQITDVHLVPEGAVLAAGLDPAPPLAAALDAVAAAGVEVGALLLTGDLADRGDATTYARLRRMHHPPLPSPSRLIQGIGLRDPGALGAVIAGSDVRVVLAGHTHVTSAGTLAGVPVWVGASTSSTWYGLTPAGGESTVRAPAVTRINLWDDGLLVSTVPVGAAGLGTTTDEQIDAAVARDRR